MVQERKKIVVVERRCKKLEPPSGQRVAFFRVGNRRDRDMLRDVVLSSLHFQNMLTILVDDNNRKVLASNCKNYRSLLLNYRVIRALVSDSSGGDVAEKVIELKTAFADNEIFSNLVTLGASLKEKNIAMLVKRLKSAYKGFFTKRKNGDLSAKPPRARKIAKANCYSIPIDQCAVSFKAKDKIRINLAEKMVSFDLDHAKILKIVGDFSAIQAVQITLQHNEIYFAISYHVSAVQADSANKPKYAGLDLGLVNLASILVNDEVTPSLIIEGAQIEDFNARNNATIARRRSHYDRNRASYEDRLAFCQREKPNATREELRCADPDLAAAFSAVISAKNSLARAFRTRHRFYTDTMHKAACRILEYLAEAQVTDLIVSKNLGEAKQQRGISRAFNRRFHQVPLVKLINYLQLKAADQGIRVFDVSEAYTSAVSCISGDVVRAQDLASVPAASRSERNKALREANVFNGRRVSRDAFRDATTGQILHADLNAACNTIRLGPGILGKDLDFGWFEADLWKLQSAISYPANSLFLDRRIRGEIKPMCNGPPGSAHAA